MDPEKKSLNGLFSLLNIRHPKKLKPFSQDGQTISIHTPPKTNMEPGNGGPLEKEIPDLETIISRFHVNFFGCTYPTLGKPGKIHPQQNVPSTGSVSKEHEAGHHKLQNLPTKNRSKKWRNKHALKWKLFRCLGI